MCCAFAASKFSISVIINVLDFTPNVVAHGEAQARFASPLVSLANLVLRRWLAYLPAPVTAEILKQIADPGNGRFPDLQ